jgi:D-cysteine desulfhydrase
VDPRAAIELIERAPRLGWVDEPTPLEPNPTLAEATGLRSLWCKRDDLAEPVRGGAKGRKLDYILARPPYRDAPVWASSGAIGSSHLLSLVDAAASLGRRLDAYSFWIPPTPGALQTLRAIAAASSRLEYRRTRVALALRWPRALFGARIKGVPVVAPGGTDPVGTLGMVRAGLELAAQLPAGAAPSRLYLAVGSGGAAAGVAIGLGLSKIPIEVHAVSIVERVFLSRRRFDGIVRQTLNELSRHFPLPAGFAPAPVVIRRTSLGPGYGRLTEGSTAAASTLVDAGLPGEGIYTGKAFDCLSQDATRGAVTDAIFWLSGSDVGSTPEAAWDQPEGWLERLPSGLQSDLRHAMQTGLPRSPY